MTKQLKVNIELVDAQITKLMGELETAKTQDDYDTIESKLETLTKLRKTMSEDKVNASYKKEIISGLVGLGGLVLVLKHEKTEVITTKAFGMLPKLFRGV